MWHERSEHVRSWDSRVFQLARRCGPAVTVCLRWSHRDRTVSLGEVSPGIVWVHCRRLVRPEPRYTIVTSRARVVLNIDTLTRHQLTRHQTDRSVKDHSCTSKNKHRAVMLKPVRSTSAASESEAHARSRAPASEHACWRLLHSSGMPTAAAAATTSSLLSMHGTSGPVSELEGWVGSWAVGRRSP